MGPLCKLELGYTRPPLRVMGGKGKVGGSFRPRVSAKALGVGSKIGGGVAKKTTIGGLFDKFNELSDSESEKENQNKFKFTKQMKIRTISSAVLDSDEDSDVSEDEFDQMSIKESVF